MVQPKKHLGQHFLTDPSIAERISSFIPYSEDQRVIEIGPGTGVLTNFLLKKHFKELLLVEIDRESVLFLNSKYPDLKETIIEADFLKLQDVFFKKPNLHIVGNFPYNISSQIFFKILEYKNDISSVTCMIQKEVAQRIVSSPGNKVYGILSVLLQAFYNTKMCFHVKPGSFYPPPKVTSSVILLNRNTTTSLGCDEVLFKRIVKATFNQRRKTIKNSIKTISLNLVGDFELLSKRPEQLTVDEFVQLTNWVESRI